MKATEIRDHMFKDFREWLEQGGFDPDRFGIDHWMFLSLNVLYNQYLDAQERTMQQSKLLHSIPEEVIKIALNQKVKSREDAEALQKEKEDKEAKENADAKKTIEDTRKETIADRGQQVESSEDDKDSVEPPKPKKSEEESNNVTDINKGKK